MENIIGSVLSFILLYKYAALFVVVFIASFGIPLPSSAMTIAAGAFAGESYLNWWLVVLAVTAGSILGDCSVYLLARFLEEKTLAWPLFRKIFTTKRRNVLETQLNNHRALAIVGSRFNGVTTLVVNIVAGFAKLSFIHFVVFDVIGESASTIAFVGIGYIFGGNWEYVSDLLTKVGAVVVLLLFLFFYKPIKRYFTTK